MATYSITADEKYPWVNLITINTDNDIDISSDTFNITVKDQLEYFVAGHISEGSTFELEELFKKDTWPTIEISNHSLAYEKQKCFTCNGTQKMTCQVCNGKGYYYAPMEHTPTMCTACGGHEADGSTYTAAVPGSGKVDCTACTDGYARTICDNELMWTEQYVNNIAQYNNSDDDSLIYNGIQFWIDGVTKRKMFIRIVTKGHSTTNSAGYSLWDPLSGGYYESNYVGFTIAMFNIALNDQEKLVFNCFNIPKVIMDDPIPENLDDLSSVSSHYEEYHILSGDIRTDYDWNENGAGENNLYVNHTSGQGNYSNIYSQYVVSNDSMSSKWATSSTTSTDYNDQMPRYIVKSSAYLNDFLVDGETLDLYSSTEDERIMSARGFNYTSANVESTLYNEYMSNSVPLEYEMSDLNTLDNFKYIEANNECVSGTLYYYEFTQMIEDSSCSGTVRKNQVKLKLEV